MIAYKYKAIYKHGTKTITIYEKDIEEAYRVMVNNFGNKDFIELKYMRKVNV